MGQRWKRQRLSPRAILADCMHAGVHLFVKIQKKVNSAFAFAKSFLHFESCSCLSRHSHLSTEKAATEFHTLRPVQWNPMSITQCWLKHSLHSLKETYYAFWPRSLKVGCGVERSHISLITLWNIAISYECHLIVKARPTFSCLVSTDFFYILGSVNIFSTRDSNNNIVLVATTFFD